MQKRNRNTMFKLIMRCANATWFCKSALLEAAYSEIIEVRHNNCSMNGEITSPSPRLVLYNC